MRIDAIQKKVVQVEALFDTGSAVSMINELYLPLGIKIEQCKKGGNKWHTNWSEWNTKISIDNR